EPCALPRRRPERAPGGIRGPGSPGRSRPRRGARDLAEQCRHARPSAPGGDRHAAHPRPRPLPRARRAA
ncbi:MAG: hypothetical protein AVDCRST_MAG40-1298, partial [uncultured Gemmatimonadaceae bacterium]